MTKPWTLLLVFLCVVAVGCGDDREKEVLKRRNNLLQLHQAYDQFFQAKGVGPTDAEELDVFMSGGDLSPEGLAARDALREGDVLLIWNGDLGGQQELSTAILGFEAVVPAHGGYVVMADGEVQVIKRGAFSSATLLEEVTAADASSEAPEDG